MKKMIGLLIIAAQVEAEQLPVPVLNENVSVKTERALECDAVLSSSDAHLLPGQPDTWTLVNTSDLVVFGMRIKSGSIYIDSSGELGASYTVTISAPQAEVNKAAKIIKNNERKTKVGSLRTESQGQTTNVICTVPGIKQ